MTLATAKPRKRWKCRRCGFPNERQWIKCRGPECQGRRPRKPQRKHAATLRGDTYLTLYVPAAREIHGVTDESCCNWACAKQRTQERHHDRDHDHETGNPRGLLCGGDNGCNVLLAKWVTAATARGIAEAKRAAGEPDAARWDGLAAYLARVDAHYAKVAT